MILVLLQGLGMAVVILVRGIVRVQGLVRADKRVEHVEYHFRRGLVVDETKVLVVATVTDQRGGCRRLSGGPRPRRLDAHPRRDVVPSRKTSVSVKDIGHRVRYHHEHLPVEPRRKHSTDPLIQMQLFANSSTILSNVNSSFSTKSLTKMHSLNSPQLCKKMLLLGWLLNPNCRHSRITRLSTRWAGWEHIRVRTGRTTWRERACHCDGAANRFRCRPGVSLLCLCSSPLAFPPPVASPLSSIKPRRPVKWWGPRWRGAAAKDQQTPPRFVPTTCCRMICVCYMCPLSKVLAHLQDTCPSDKTQDALLNSQRLYRTLPSRTFWRLLPLNSFLSQSFIKIKGLNCP